MNKSQIITALAERAGISRANAEKAIEALFGIENGIVAEALRQGDRVRLSGFGSFEAKPRRARMGRNPRTGAAIEIGPSASATFRPGRTLKESFGADVHGPGGGGRAAAAMSGRGEQARMSDTHGSGKGGRK